MARIRTIKPEMFESEDLAAVDLTAERTFAGMLTQVDDNGRFRDNAALLHGRLWTQRAWHTPAHVANDLEQLAEIGLVCRYIGCDGKKYLHVVSFPKHQKIDRPSPSRLPRCPVHQPQDRCGECQAEHCPSREADVLGEDSTNRRRALAQPVPAGSPHGRTAGGTASSADIASSGAHTSPQLLSDDVAAETAAHTPVEEASASPRRGVAEGSASGSRIVDPGSLLAVREAPAPESAPASDGPAASAKELVAAYVAGCAHRPPKDTLGHLGRQVRRLLDEGFDPGPVATALERLRAKGLHPSVLPSVVNEVLNASGVGQGPPGARPGYTPWMNPADASVYQEAL